MKNFDEERVPLIDKEREFQIGGEVFIRRASVRPEVWLPYQDLDGSESSAEVLVIFDSIVCASIEPDGDAIARFHEVRAREDDAINEGDIAKILAWLYTETTRRPTVAPSHSTAGRAPSGTPSTDASSLRAVTG